MCASGKRGIWGSTLCGVKCESRFPQVWTVGGEKWEGYREEKRCNYDDGSEIWGQVFGRMDAYWVGIGRTSRLPT